MRTALIDVGEWRTLVEFQSGRPQVIGHRLMGMAAQLAHKHPYPGDLGMEAARWVTDTAIDLDRLYNPDFMMLAFATPYLLPAFTPLSEVERIALVDGVFTEIDRFFQSTTYCPVIVGLGDIVPTQGYVDLTGTDGLVVAGGMSARYAGLHKGTARDLTFLAGCTGIQRIVDRDALIAELAGGPEFCRRVPDHLLVAAEGYVLRGLGSSARPLHYLPKFDHVIPMHTSLGSATALTDVSRIVLDALHLGKRVALVLVEGVGCMVFPMPYQEMTNTDGWYCYAPGEGQYHALTTGRHLGEIGYPPGYAYFIEDDECQRFPFSGHYREMPANTIGNRHSGRTAAVGNRGMFTHVASGADITVECFVRNLYNHGIMVVLK